MNRALILLCGPLAACAPIGSSGTTTPTGSTPAGVPTGFTTGTGAVDADGDGYSPPDDCDDSDDTVHPGAPEICDNGQDDDCDGALGACRLEGNVPLASSTVRLDGAAFDLAGEVIVAGTDLGGDGAADLLISGYASARGKIYVVDAPFTSSDLPTAARAVLGGQGVADLAGSAMDTVGDFDGDGLPDLLIGAPGQDLADGLAYLVSGTVSGNSALDAVALARWQGGAGDRLGIGVAGIGDASGDAVDDLAIAAFQVDGIDDETGMIGLFFGPTVSGGSLMSADAAIHGDVAGARLGSPLVGADLDGDGIGDIAAGVERPQNGAIALFLGPFSGNTMLADADALAVAEGNQDWPNALGEGDTTGDGMTDLLIGVIEAGAAYMVAGPPSGTIDLFLADARILDEDLGAAFGSSVASAGDVDGDGFSDVLVGAHGDQTFGTQAGAAYLYYGPVTGTMAKSDADAIFVPPEPYASVGTAVAAAGDATGDGLPDVWIGASTQDSNGTDAGSVHLVAGAGW